MQARSFFLNGASLLSFFALLTALSILAFFFLSADFDEGPPPLTPKPPFPSPASPKDTYLTVEETTFSGVDEQKTPYSISAKKARQNSIFKGQTFLETVSGTFGDLQSFHSKQAIYYSASKTVLLKEDVFFEQKGSWTLQLPKATLNLQTRLLEGDGPVTARVPHGNIKAGSVKIKERENYILFSNKVFGTFQENREDK